MLPVDFFNCDNCPHVPETAACLNCTLNDDVLVSSSDYDSTEDDFFFDDCYTCRFHGFCGGICIAYEL